MPRGARGCCYIGSGREQQLRWRVLARAPLAAHHLAPDLGARPQPELLGRELQQRVGQRTHLHVLVGSELQISAELAELA